MCNIFVNSLENNKVAMNKNVNDIDLVIHSSKGKTSLTLMDMIVVLDMEIRIASTKPKSLPNSSINPLLKPL